MLKLLKQSGGGGYLIGAFTNRFQDRERQTITDAAHRDFERFLNENPSQSPVLMQRHMESLTFKNRAEWWGYSGSAMVMVWPLEKEEIQIVEDMQKRYGDLGMSHGVKNKDVTIEIDPATGNELITKYRSFEASILPLDRAANYFTQIQIVEDTNNMFDQKQIDMMSKAIAKATAQTLMGLGEKLDNEAKALEQSGVYTKEVSENADPVPEVGEVAPEQEPNAELAELREVVEALVGTIEAQNSKIESLQKSLGKVEKQLGNAKAEKKAQAKPSWKSNIFSRINGTNGINGAIPIEENDPIMKSRPITNDGSGVSFNDRIRAKAVSQ